MYKDEHYTNILSLVHIEDLHICRQAGISLKKKKK